MEGVKAGFGVLGGETSRSAFAQLQCFAVITGCRASLAEVVQADGEVVGDVGIVRRQAVSVEPGLLGFGPALLAAQGVSQGKAQGQARWEWPNSELFSITPILRS